MGNRSHSHPGRCRIRNQSAPPSRNASTETTEPNDDESPAEGLTIHHQNRRIIRHRTNRLDTQTRQPESQTKPSTTSRKSQPRPTLIVSDFDTDQASKHRLIVTRRNRIRHTVIRPRPNRHRHFFAGRNSPGAFFAPGIAEAADRAGSGGTVNSSSAGRSDSNIVRQPDTDRNESATTGTECAALAALNGPMRVRHRDSSGPETDRQGGCLSPRCGRDGGK